MMVNELIRNNRSYRRFDYTYKLDNSLLKDLVELARYSPSARNAQPLKSLLVNSEDECDAVFPALSWAGYLKGWDGPAPGERPAAYIIVLGDTRLAKTFEWDAAIACQSMLLGAVERGLGGCMVGSVKRDKLHSYFKLPGYLQIHLVLALGKPAEKVVIDDCPPGEPTEYWRDGEDVHHVPKRGLDELIVN